MIGQVDPTRLDPRQRAELIYAQARSELSNRLWQAVLGAGDRAPDGADPAARNGEISLDSLLAMLVNDIEKPMPAPPRPEPIAAQAPEPPRALARDEGARSGGERSGDAPEPASAAGLGANAQYRARLQSAAERTGIPAPALAAIVNAEAARGADGRWLPYSRNPRSSAAGLGQFLSGTWKGEAERAGSWLNAVATARGWLDARGRVEPEARSQLLALRYDADVSIEAIADYARMNLDALRRAGVTIDDDSDAIAKAAYLGHHLGIGDAVRFLKGGLDSARARKLLVAQIGGTSASARIAAAGSAAGAHRAWLTDYVDRNVRPARFAHALAS